MSTKARQKERILKHSALILSRPSPRPHLVPTTILPAPTRPVFTSRARLVPTLIYAYMSALRWLGRCAAEELYPACVVVRQPSFCLRLGVARSRPRPARLSREAVFGKYCVLLFVGIGEV